MVESVTKKMEQADFSGDAVQIYRAFMNAFAQGMNDAAANAFAAARSSALAENEGKASVSQAMEWANGCVINYDFGTPPDQPATRSKGWSFTISGKDEKAVTITVGGSWSF